MPAPSRATLVINDGTLPGLVAFWIEATRRPAGKGVNPEARPAGHEVISWFPAGASPARAPRFASVQRQASLCPNASVVEGDARPPETSADRTPFLVAVAQEAIRHGASRVVWPVHVPPANAPEAPADAPPPADVELMSDLCDRAFLVGELMSLDARPTGLSVEVPFIDLSDEQIVDLAIDLDAPLNACWWCRHAGEHRCGECRDCIRWANALRAVDPAALEVRVVAGKRKTRPEA